MKLKVFVTVKNFVLGNSLAVQWLGLGALTAGPGFDPWW